MNTIEFFLIFWLIWTLSFLTLSLILDRNRPQFFKRHLTVIFLILIVSLIITIRYDLVYKDFYKN